MNRTLTERLGAAVDDDAREAFYRTVRAVREATDVVPALRRNGDLLVLLCADAFNPHRSQRARERRWQRFIRALAPVARKTRSRALCEIVGENADLLGGRLAIDVVRGDAHELPASA